MREIQTSTPAIGHFPIFEPDGYTPHSGLTNSDFVAVVYRDSAPIALPVAVSEIGVSGEYRYQFTPVLLGVYDLELRCLFNQVWLGDTIQCVATKNDDLLIQVADDTQFIRTRIG